MRIDERLKRWLELVRLRSRARRSPSPASCAELAERLATYGRTDDALRAAESGLELFPHSDRLAQVRLFARRGRRAAELRRLREDVAHRPSPVAYSRLAALYRELDHADEALETACECAERFPLSESPWILQGELRLDRFARDMVARDAVVAEESLRRALRVNGRSVRALMLLAELRWLVGDAAACRELLGTVLAICPTEPGVPEFAATLEAAAGAGSAPPDFAELAELVEERRTFSVAPDRFPSVRPAARGPREPGAVDPGRLRAELARLASAGDVLGAVAIDRAGELLADASADGALPGAQLAELAADLAGAADDACRRMDAGAIVRAEVAGPAGQVLVARVRGLTVAVVHRAPLRSEHAWELVQDALARATVRPGEAVRA